MPKLTNRPPKLSRSGKYAYVYFNGDRLPMGKWGDDPKKPSEEAKKNHRQFIAEWAKNAQASTIRPGAQITVDELFAAYLDYAKTNIDPCDYRHHRIIAQEILDVYSGTPVENFGPKALLAVQGRLETSGRVRGYCNKLINFARAQFRWGVAQEMVPESIPRALKYVPALRQGKTIAPETPPREDVPDEVVKRTLPYLYATIAIMVQVQRLACMRPSEVCRMKVGDLDQSGKIWIYRPGFHKGTWRKQDKAVPLGKPEQKLLAPRLVGKGPDQYVFSPFDTLQERKAKFAAKRKHNWPCRAALREERAAKPKLNVRDYYTSETYSRALKRSIETANKEIEAENGKPEKAGKDPTPAIPFWTPYQLRHAAVTEITETHGLDVAQAVAGQRSIQVTKRYDHSALKIATKHAEGRTAKFGKKAKKQSSRGRGSEDTAVMTDH